MTPDELRSLADAPEGTLHTEMLSEAEMTLLALAPDLARLCADAFDYLAEEREGWTEEGAVEVPRLDALLAKLSELNSGAERT